MTLRRLVQVLVVVASATLVVGCGDDDSTETVTATTGGDGDATTGGDGDGDTTGGDGDGDTTAGDGDGDGDTTGGDGDGDTDSAQLRVVHASPGAPAVDIYAVGVDTPLFTNLAYTETTEFLSVAPGTYQVEVRVAGTDTVVFTTGDVPLAADDKLTAVAAGIANPDLPADQQFRVIPLFESFDAPSDGNAIVRIVHASATAPTVNLDVGDDGTVEVPGLERYADTGAAGVQLPADTALQVAVLAGEARVTAFTASLPAGAEVFLIATGLLEERPADDFGFGILAVGPAGTVGLVRQNPIVYALHGGPDAPAVDICAGALPLAAGLSFGQLSGAIQVPPGTYDLNFHVANENPCTNDVAVGPFSTGPIDAGLTALAIAAGELASETDEASFTVLLQPAVFDGSEGNAAVKLIHASGDAGLQGIDLGTLSNGTIVDPPQIPDFQLGNSVDVVLPPATYTIGAGAGGAAPVGTFTVPLTADAEVFAVAAGTLTDSGEQAFRLLVIDAKRFETPATIPFSVSF